MSLEADLYLLLKEDRRVTEIVGARIYPLFLPQNPTLPALVFRRVSAARNHSHDGNSGLTESRVQFDCWAGNHVDAIALASVVRVALGGTTWLGDTFVDNEIDMYEPDREFYRRIVDVIVWHEE